MKVFVWFVIAELALAGSAFGQGRRPGSLPPIVSGASAISPIPLPLWPSVPDLPARTIDRSSGSPFGPPFRVLTEMDMPDSEALGPIDFTAQDDQAYYHRAPFYVPLLKITGSNVGLWFIDHYIFQYDFSRIGLRSWGNNLRSGFHWNDSDRFGINFFFHPFTGGGYFMDARALGYPFWGSIPFAAIGSVQWEYFGETTRPSIPDLINTTVNGTFLGEVAYRLTSNILDDSKTGPERIVREAAAGIISPSRFFSRLLTGKLWSTSPAPSLEQAPMDIRWSVGPHIVNDGTDIGSGVIKASLNAQIEYGDSFGQREHTPFDHFKLWGELTSAEQRKYLGEITGYGLLTGANTTIGDWQLLYGLFQHFDYFDNLAFELGDIGFGPGVVTKLQLSRHHSLYSNVHLSFIPFGANNNGDIPDDTSQVRDYSYGDGLQVMTETGFELGDRRVDVAILGYYIYFHSYYGRPVDNSMVLLKPRIAVRLWDNLGIGIEHQLYTSDHSSGGIAASSVARTEQRLFLQWTWNDFSQE